jgi:Xaa-Pro aminopeptidase
VQSIVKAVRETRWFIISTPNPLYSRGLIHDLRLTKSPAEITLMRQSAAIASDAIGRTIAATGSCASEAQLFATVDYHCRMSGAQYLAYPPVVAAGDNANTIHVRF